MTRGRSIQGPSPPDVTVVMVDNALVIRFGQVLHLRIDDRRQLRGLQSWRIKKINRYFIEYTLEGGVVITSDYDGDAKWKAILAGLEKVL